MRQTKQSCRGCRWGHLTTMAPYNRKHIHENSGKAGAMARGGGAFSDEEIQLLRGLPAVANVTRNRITYADSFKQVCTIRYLTGESPTKIFREAGLPPDLIGYKRIERCVDRWKTSAIKSVTGSGNMSDSEIIAQLVNRYEHAFVMRRNLDSITNRTMEHIPVKAQGDDGITWEREHHHQTAGAPYRRTGARERRTARANRRHRLTQTIVMPRKCLVLQNRTLTQAKTGLSCPFLVNRTSNAAKVRCGCPFLQNRTTGVLKVCCGCPFLQNQTSEARFVSDSWAYLTYMADLLMRHEPFRLYMAVRLRKYAQNVPPLSGVLP